MSSGTEHATAASGAAAVALAHACCTARPGAAGRVLETAAPGQAAELLASVPPKPAARVLATLSLHQALGIVSELAAADRRAILLELAPSLVANVLRGADERARSELLECLEASERGPIAALLSQRAGTVGAHVDPHALSMPAKGTVGEALEQIRLQPERSHDSLFLTGSDQALVGVVSVRALLLEPPEVALERFTGARPESLFAATQMDVITHHPCWQHTCVMPVTDRDGRFMGVLNQRQLAEPAAPEEPQTTAGRTAGALAELYGLGALAVVQWAATLWKPPRSGGNP